MATQETVWIKNAKGMKSSVTPELAEYFVSKRVGWGYCEPEAVPEFKQYPEDLELTEKGEKRRARMAANTQKVEAVKAEVRENAPEETDDYKELQALAKERGVEKYWLKGKDTLKNELGMV